jgi:hypothetical protein
MTASPRFVGLLYVTEKVVFMLSNQSNPHDVASLPTSSTGILVVCDDTQQKPNSG